MIHNSEDEFTFTGLSEDELPTDGRRNSYTHKIQQCLANNDKMSKIQQNKDNNFYWKVFNSYL